MKGGDKQQAYKTKAGFMVQTSKVESKAGVGG